MKIWMSGHAEPTDVEATDLRRLVSEGTLKKDALLLDPASKQWVQLGEHPVTSVLFASYQPAVPPTPPKRAPRFRKSLWIMAALFLAVVSAGVGIHEVLRAEPSSVPGFVGRTLAILGACLLLGFFFGKFSLARRRGLPLALSLGAASLLLLASLVAEIPDLRKKSMTLAYDRAIADIERDTGTGKISPRKYGAFRYGHYAPFLDLLHTMACDYEKEVADFHKGMADILAETPGGPDVLQKPDALAKIRAALDRLEDHCGEHRSFIEDRLEFYRLRFEVLPYSQDTKDKALAEFDRLRQDVLDMTGDYFQNMTELLQRLDGMLMFCQKNPQAFHLELNDRGRWPGGYSPQNLDSLLSYRLSFTDPSYAAEYRRDADEIRKTFIRKSAIQDQMNHYYGNQGQTIIHNLEQIIRSGS